MRGRHLFLILLMILMRAPVHAQGDSTAKRGYFSLGFNNDTFTNTDRYYTQGFRVELSRQPFAKLPTRHILLRMRHSNKNLYGASLVQDIFTPSSIHLDQAIYGDRPYAATAYIGMFLISENGLRKARITTEIDLGIIGPLAGGYEVQTEYHKMIGMRLPKGWERQVNNDIVLNYGLKMEKGIFATRIADLTAFSEFNAGTLYMNAVPGLEFRSGKVGSWSYNEWSRWRAYIICRAHIKAVGYNATLQGGLFNKDNGFTLGPQLMERFVPGGQACIVLSYRKIGIECGYFYQEAELKYGTKHRWGHMGLKLGL